MTMHFAPHHHHGIDALHSALYWNGRERHTWQTAIEMLLPFAAAMFGLAAFGLVYYVTAASAV